MASSLPSNGSNKGDLTKGSLRSHLVRLSVPMVWGIFAIISFQLVDTFYVSLLGTKELAALSFTFPVNFVIFSFIMGFGIAMSSVISRLIGEGHQDTVKRVVLHGLITVFAIGVLLAVIGIALHDPIFRLLGADEEMITLIRSYMLIWFGGAVFVTLPLVGNAAIRATGDTVVPAVIMSVVAIVNIILDPILIFGLFGFPRLELQGAAIATIIANAAACFAGLYVLYFKKKLISGMKSLHLDQFKDSLRRLLFIALPAGLTNSIQPIVNGIILAMLAGHGPEAVAAFGIATRVEAFAFVILMAVAVGMSPIIGQNWGAGLYPRVHETLKLSIRFSVLWSVFIAIVLGVFAKPIAGIFSTDQEVIYFTALFFWVIPVSYPMANLISGWASAFNAMGMPQRSFFMIVVKMVICMIPAVILGNYLDGVFGIFFAICMVNILTGIAYHTLNWRLCIQKGERASAS